MYVINVEFFESQPWLNVNNFLINIFNFVSNLTYYICSYDFFNYNLKDLSILENKQCLVSIFK